MKKTLFKISGYTAVGLGFAGAFLPVLPTTPFLLLAAFCFSRSSPRMNRWLLRNRYFGSHLRNYRSGRGIPMPVKISTLSVMWVTMLCTAFLLTDRLWLQIMLIAIASGVTIHLCRVKTLKQKKVLVLFPTEGEAVPFKNMQPSGVTCAITGVGPIESAINTTALIWQHKPDIVILAGIAGTYSGSGLETGDVVLVSNETDADTGSFSEGEFTPKFSLTTYCPYILPRYSLPAVESNSVSAAAAPFIDRGTAAIENMEGAAFFRVCTEAGVRFLELRAVSNTVGEAFCLWNIPLATANLARRLKRIINEV